MEADRMESLRLALATITTQLGRLTRTHQLLIGAVAVVLVMTLFLVAQWTAKPATVPLFPGAPAADQQRAASHLDEIGFEKVMKDGVVHVAAQDAARARALLGEAGKLPDDKTLLFATLIQNQSWTNSRQMNEQNYRLALQNELAAMIRGFKGVSRASVVIDAPEVSGLGQAVRRPTAAATVATQNGQPLSQAMVDAVAGLIAGSQAGLDVERIRIIDVVGGQRRPRTQGDELSTTYMEHAARVEAQTHQKVSDLLRYIDGVMVAVTAQVDVTSSVAEVTTFMPEKQGSVSLRKKEDERTLSTSETSAAAEPGFGANQTADINRAPSAGAGVKSDTSESTGEFENKFGSRAEKIVDPKGYPTMVAISVNVPRAYVARLIPAPAPAGGAPAGGEPPAGPTDAQVQDKFETDVRPMILAGLAPQVRALSNTRGGAMTPEQLTQLVSNSVGVSMVPFDLPGPATAGAAGVLGVAGGLGLGAGLVDKGVLALLGVVAMGMMLMLVRKAGRAVETPSAEELVGMPPTLDAQADVVGEADEGDTAMAGIEVGDDQMQSQQLLEQVGELVEKSPESAAKLIGRWISVEE